MPDNVSHGMLETFLRHLVNADAVWLERRARRIATAALRSGAPCHASHIDKAAIHTFLAWQEPPGLSFGRAILKKVLDPESKYAAPFVGWFRTPYEL
jgi:hypothetical protein